MFLKHIAYVYIYSFLMYRGKTELIHVAVTPVHRSLTRHSHSAMISSSACSATAFSAQSLQQNKNIEPITEIKILI